jgi:two-component system, NarL family, nitrate/nitrite response regulator NarL
MSNTVQITTILGCKNSMLREGLKHILSSTRYKVHPEDLTRRDRASAVASDAGPLLFIVDSGLYTGEMPEAIKSLKERYAGSKIVVLADGFDLDEMKVALHAGADGYCLATTGCEALIKYLDLVMLGEFVFPSTAFLAALSESGERAHAPKEPSVIKVSSLQVVQSSEAKDSPARTLSSREAEILHCLMQGAPNKVIARKLDVAEATVKVHIKAILRKIRVANRTQAAMWAVNHFSAGSSEPSWMQSSSQGSSLTKAL